jgi:hypothetical protein
MCGGLPGSMAKMNQLFIALLRRAIEKDCAAEEALKVVEKISGLDRAALVALMALLMQGPGRFDVKRASRAWPLVERGLLLNAHHFDSKVICDLHPALLAKRKELIRILSRALQT